MLKQGTPEEKWSSRWTRTATPDCQSHQNISTSTSSFLHISGLLYYQRGIQVAGQHAGETTEVFTEITEALFVKGVSGMLGRILWTIIVVLVVLWLVGLLAHIAGGFVHLLLIVALLVLLFNLFAGRRARGARRW
jgi:cell division protein FtsW (lipid II flippase)